MYSAISYLRTTRALCSASSLLRGDGGFCRYASFLSSPASPGKRNAEPDRNSKPMDFVRTVIDQETSQFSRLNDDENADCVHIKLLRNNTFVTVTDPSGNTKLGGLKASSGMVPELKGGPKLSRYVAEATSEHVGRKAREMGLRSVVVKVNGFSFFKKKRQAIMSLKEGFGNSIVSIEDTTRKPHSIVVGRLICWTNRS